MSKPTLLYFPIPGRAVGPRLALFALYGEDGWNNEAISFADFGAEKMKGKDGKLKTGSLPQLTLENGQVLTQSHAIARYAALKGRAKGNTKAGDLYPTSPEVSCFVDEIYAQVDDTMTAVPRHEDKGKLKELREGFQKGKLTDMFMMWEAKIAETGGPFVLGASLTLADCAIYQICWAIGAGMEEFIDPKFPDQFPGITKLKQAYDEHDLVKAYRAKFPDY